MLDENELELAAHVLGHLHQVVLVVAWHYYLLTSGAMSRKHLVTDRADGQHLAPQRNLARHRYFLAYGPFGQSGDERRCHRDSGRRSIFGNRTRRHVDVNVVLVERRWRYVEHGGA